MRRVAYSIITLFPLVFANVANAENEQSQIGQKSWFVEGRYQKSINESTGFNDKDTTSSKVVSVTGEKWDNLDSTGIAIGKFFDDGKISLSFGYENFGSVNKTFATATQQNGTVVRNVILPMDITNMMVEFGYNIPISENMFAIGIAGFGQAKINSKKYSANGLAGQGKAKEVENTSTRFGFGIGYNISSSTSIIGIVQQSDYGDAEVLAGSSAATIFASEVNASEASIRLRVAF